MKKEKNVYLRLGNIEWDDLSETNELPTKHLLAVTVDEGDDFNEHVKNQLLDMIPFDGDVFVDSFDYQELNEAQFNLEFELTTDIKRLMEMVDRKKVKLHNILVNLYSYEVSTNDDNDISVLFNFEEHVRDYANVSTIEFPFDDDLPNCRKAVDIYFRACPAFQYRGDVMRLRFYPKMTDSTSYNGKSTESVLIDQIAKLCDLIISESIRHSELIMEYADIQKHRTLK